MAPHSHGEIAIQSQLISVADALGTVIPVIIWHCSIHRDT